MIPRVFRNEMLLASNINILKSVVRILSARLKRIKMSGDLAVQAQQVYVVTSLFVRLRAAYDRIGFATTRLTIREYGRIEAVEHTAYRVCR